MKTQETNVKQVDNKQHHNQELSSSPCKVDRDLLEVAERAYYKAESRGFAPGYELEDWLEAESVFKPS
jgi:hypothetical protein